MMMIMASQVTFLPTLIVLIAVVILQDYCSSFSYRTSTIKIATKDDSIFYNKRYLTNHYNLHPGSYVSSLMTSKRKNQNGNDYDSLEAIDGVTLLSVETCINLHRNNIEYDISNKRSNKESKVVFVDASWWHKGSLNGRQIFEEGPRIKGSVYLDLDDISSQFDLFPTLNPKKLPHMMPPMNLFTALMNEYNISNEDHIIIYGRESVFFIPRIWFMFRSFGHDKTKLHLMQGSLEDWIRLGGEVESTAVKVPQAANILQQHQKNNKNDINCGYIANHDTSSYIVSIEDMMNRVSHQQQDEERDYVIIDSRGSSFIKGHIPNSIHIPYNKFTETDNSLQMKSKNDIHKIFKDAGIDPNTEKNVICSCGSGVSACTTFLALELCGRNVDDTNSTLMYDGSWSEWGNEGTTPKVITPKEDND